MFNKRYKFNPFERKYADIRIKKTGKKGYDFILILKYEDKKYRLYAKAKNFSEKKKTTSYKEYKRLLELRKKEFTNSLDRKIDKLKTLPVCVQLLVPKQLDTTMSEKSVNYLKELLYSRIRTSSKRGISYINSYSCHYLAKHIANENYPDWAMNPLTAEQWLQKIETYEPSVRAYLPVYQDVYRGLEKPVPVLRLTGFGVFNLDVLKRFEEEKRILASYETEDGQRLRLIKTEIVNHRLNGLLRFTKPEIYLDLGSPTTIIAHTTDGKVYYLKPDDAVRAELRKTKEYTFKMKPLGDYIAKPELIRKLIEAAS